MFHQNSQTFLQWTWTMSYSFDVLSQPLPRNEEATRQKWVLILCPTINFNINKYPIVAAATIFEFDQRFCKYDPDFVKYDYNEAKKETYLSEFKSKFDLVVLDIPFLSSECLEKSNILCRKLAKEDAKIILCTGKIMSDAVSTLMVDLKMCKFEPEHERNLGNDFGTFANFDLDMFLKWCDW